VLERMEGRSGKRREGEKEENVEPYFSLFAAPPRSQLSAALRRSLRLAALDVHRDESGTVLRPEKGGEIGKEKKGGEERGKKRSILLPTRAVPEPGYYVVAIATPCVCIVRVLAASGPEGRIRERRGKGGRCTPANPRPGTRCLDCSPAASRCSHRPSLADAERGGKKEGGKEKKRGDSVGSRVIFVFAREAHRRPNRISDTPWSPTCLHDQLSPLIADPLDRSKEGRRRGREGKKKGRKIDPSSRTPRDRAEGRVARRDIRGTGEGGGEGKERKRVSDITIPYLRRLLFSFPPVRIP